MNKLEWPVRFSANDIWPIEKVFTVTVNTSQVEVCIGPGLVLEGWSVVSGPDCLHNEVLLAIREFFKVHFKSLGSRTEEDE